MNFWDVTRDEKVLLVAIYDVHPDENDMSEVGERVARAHVYESFGRQPKAFSYRYKGIPAHR